MCWWLLAGDYELVFFRDFLGIDKLMTFLIIIIILTYEISNIYEETYKMLDFF